MGVDVDVDVDVDEDVDSMRVWVSVISRKMRHNMTGEAHKQPHEKRFLWDWLVLGSH